MRRALAIAIAIAAAGLSAPARAEQVIVSLSSDRVFINSNFTGAELALFGSIERDAMTVLRPGDYEVAVTVRGPRGSVVVREKRRFGPLYVNLEQRRFIAVPSFIAILSTRPVAEIADAGLRDAMHLGIEELVPRQGAGLADAKPEFREGLIRLRREQNLFLERPKGVQMLSPRLFRAAVGMPGRAPLGAYEVDVAVFAEGAVVAKATQSFQVIKSGVEQSVAAASRERALAYGLSASGLALALGWLASVIFRRD